MASSFPRRLITPRDREIFAALNRGPLTAQQLLKCSQTFALPFCSLRRIQERLYMLFGTGCVQRWFYATAGPGGLYYYKLTTLGYRLLHGPKVPLPAKRCFYPVSLSLQEHTRKLADFIVHTAVAAHEARVDFVRCFQENELRLELGDERLLPDSAFQLIAPGGRSYSFLVELDNGTEPVCSRKERDSLEKKIRFYDRYQDCCAQRFRVLVVTTSSEKRQEHILETAGRITKNPQRRLFYAISLTQYLRQSDAVRAACFLDHNKQPVALVPSLFSAPNHDVQHTELAQAAVVW